MPLMLLEDLEEAQAIAYELRRHGWRIAVRRFPSAAETAPASTTSLPSAS
jgi:hypothetical protein